MLKSKGEGTGRARQKMDKMGKKREIGEKLRILTHFDRGGHRDPFWSHKSTSCCVDLSPQSGSERRRGREAQKLRPC